MGSSVQQLAHMPMIPVFGFLFVDLVMSCLHGLACGMVAAAWCNLGGGWLHRGDLHMAASIDAYGSKL